jgi:AAA ATPase domain
MRSLSSSLLPSFGEHHHDEPQNIGGDTNSNNNSNDRRRRPPVKLFGREREMEMLQSIIQQTIERSSTSTSSTSTLAAQEEEAHHHHHHHHHHHIVMIQGDSGCGKTTLVEEARLLPTSSRLQVATASAFGSTTAAATASPSSFFQGYHVYYYGYGAFSHPQQQQQQQQQQDNGNNHNNNNSNNNNNNNLNAIGKMLGQLVRRLLHKGSAETIQRIQQAFSDEEQELLCNLWLVEFYPLFGESLLFKAAAKAAKAAVAAAVSKVETSVDENAGGDHRSDGEEEGNAKRRSLTSESTSTFPCFHSGAFSLQHATSITSSMESTTTLAAVDTNNREQQQQQHYEASSSSSTTPTTITAALGISHTTGLLLLQNLVLLFLQTLASAPDTGILVLVLDDLQWMDQASLQILTHILNITIKQQQQQHQADDVDDQHQQQQQQQQHGDEAKDDQQDRGRVGNPNPTTKTTPSSMDTLLAVENNEGDEWMKKLVFIGLHRTIASTDNDNGNNLLGTTQAVQWLQCDKELQRATKTKIRLQYLPLESVRDILCDMLQRPPVAKEENTDDMDDLAKLVYHRTRGNPFFVRQLVHSLQELGLIQYRDIGNTTTDSFNRSGVRRKYNFQWTWDPSKIQSCDILLADDEAIQIVVDRLRHFPESVQNCLQVCACLGPKFSIGILESIMAYFDDAKDAAAAASSADLLFSISDLEFARDEQLVEETHHHRVYQEDESPPDKLDQLIAASSLPFPLSDKKRIFYRFVHDKIYETAIGLRVRGPCERELLHLQIGRAIRSKLFVAANDDDAKPPPFDVMDDTVLFCCTDQFNYGKDLITDQDETLFLARLNLAAGKRCCDGNAYLSAESHFTIGISLLEGHDPPRNPWEWQGALLVDLHTCLAETALCLGKLSKVQNIVDKVTGACHATSGDADLFCLRYAYLISLRMSNQIQLLIDETLKLLEELGDTIDANISRQDFEAKRGAFVKRFRNISDVDILNLPEMKSRRCE